MKPSIFNDPEIQARFDRDGYVVLDFIGEAEARHIAEKFYELHEELPKGFYSAAFSSDDGFKHDIYTHTQAVFEKVVDETFHDYKILGSTFLCKSPGEEGRVGVHQDWSVVDESKFYSATVWVPTVDTTEENGALRVLPGSHLFFDHYRSNNIPVGYRGCEQLLWDNMVTVPMKAGQAFVLNHAVIHASSPNRTDRERLAVAYGLVPKDAPLMYYHKNTDEPGDTIEKFDMPDDFFQRYYNIGQRPLFGESVGQFAHPVPAAGEAAIRDLINRERVLRQLPPLAEPVAEPVQEAGSPSFFSAVKKWFSRG